MIYRQSIIGWIRRNGLIVNVVDYYYLELFDQKFWFFRYLNYSSKISYEIIKIYRQGIYHGTICTANILVDHYMIGRLTGLTGAQEVTENMNKNMQLPMYAAPESVHLK